MNGYGQAEKATRFKIEKHVTHGLCIFAAVALFLFVLFKDERTANETSCTDTALASRFAAERQANARIDVSKYGALDSGAMRELLGSNPEVCSIPGSSSTTPQAQPAFLYRDRNTGRHYLVFESDFGDAEKAGFGPVQE